GGLSKAGFRGVLTLSGFNVGSLTGPININEGGLRLTDVSAVDPASPLRFNDRQSGSSSARIQTLDLALGDGTSGTFANALQFADQNLSTFGFAYPNEVFNDSNNSRVTLSGVVSSAAGRTTNVSFTSPPTSGVNLTGVNTFTGDVGLFGGGALGVSGNASLGDPANRLTLRASNDAAGGLEFLAGGIDLPRALFLVGPNRFVSNGSDVNTLSGPIADSPGTAGALVKAGAGTLVLSGTNTYTGGTRVDAGTLRVGADANLGAAAGPVTINTGATVAATGTFSASRPVQIGPASGAGVATVDVASGATVALSGTVSDRPGGSGGLLKTGPGALALTGTNTYTGGTTVNAGVLQVGGDASLGAGPVTVGPFGTLRYAATATTARTFTLNAGVLEAPAGVTLTLNGAAVGGGFLRGAGTFAATGGAVLAGATTSSSSTVTVSGPASFANFTNGGALAVTAGVAGPVTFSLFTNQPAGSVTVGATTGAGSTVSASDFQTSGVLTIPNAPG
ncbi:MAG TPA: autotransporter-associated beta strand repeat-containing protein, partial [Gemmataceae bacterium]